MRVGLLVILIMTTTSFSLRRFLTAPSPLRQLAQYSVSNSRPPGSPRVLSGIQPTGTIHLGNYLGAIQQWVQNQEKYENFFCVVDLHAITVPHDPAELRKNTIEMAAMYLAAGIDPVRSKIFVQSHVRAHAELAWLLNCVTPVGWLTRMVQFKDKSQSQGESVRMGLLDYPVLMAADILLYNTDLVPVGDDQLQHLELTRDICRRFNDQFCHDKGLPPVFKEPQALVSQSTARLMSLTDGTAKMSKSAPNDYSRINLLDSKELIQKKIKKCKTDQVRGLEADNPERPECANLLAMYRAVSNMTAEEAAVATSGMSWGQFKPLLTEAVVAHVEPIQKRYYELMADQGHLHRVLAEGKEAAESVAEKTLLKAKEAMGFHIIPK